MVEVAYNGNNDSSTITFNINNCGEHIVVYGVSRKTKYTVLPVHINLYVHPTFIPDTAIYHNSVSISHINIINFNSTF